MVVQELFPYLLSPKKTNFTIDKYTVYTIHILYTFREGVPKKNTAVHLDFVQMRGGAALPKFVVTFS